MEAQVSCSKGSASVHIGETTSYSDIMRFRPEPRNHPAFEIDGRANSERDRLGGVHRPGSRWSDKQIVQLAFHQKVNDQLNDTTQNPRSS